jgi:hypothetical protein
MDILTFAAAVVGRYIFAQCYTAPSWLGSSVPTRKSNRRYRSESWLAEARLLGLGIMVIG